MLRQIAEGVLIHQSEFLHSNAVVVAGRAGVLLVDPGVLGDELVCLANDLSEASQTVAVGFLTHPQWDHLFRHEKFRAATRYGTAGCAATVRERLSDAGAKARVAEMIPPDIAGHRRAGAAGAARRLAARCAHPAGAAPRVRTGVACRGCDVSRWLPWPVHRSCSQRPGWCTRCG